MNSAKYGHCHAAVGVHHTGMLLVGISIVVVSLACFACTETIDDTHWPNICRLRPHRHKPSHAGYVIQLSVALYHQLHSNVMVWHDPINHTVEFCGLNLLKTASTFCWWRRSYLARRGNKSTRDMKWMFTWSSATVHHRMAITHTQTHRQGPHSTTHHIGPYPNTTRNSICKLCVVAAQHHHSLSRIHLLLFKSIHFFISSKKCVPCTYLLISLSSLHKCINNSYRKDQIMFSHILNTCKTIKYSEFKCSAANCQAALSKN